jgi:hypothetical protein
MDILDATNRRESPDRGESATILMNSKYYKDGRLHIPLEELVDRATAVLRNRVQGREDHRFVTRQESNAIQGR